MKTSARSYEVISRSVTHPPGERFVMCSGSSCDRQAALWYDWHPWFTLVSIVIPIGFLLSHASRWWGVTAGINVANYWVLWDFSYLAVPGWRRDVIDVAWRVGSGCLALVGWSWTSGFVLGRVSRRTVWLTDVDVRRRRLLRDDGDGHRWAANSGESVTAVPRRLRRVSAFLPNLSGDVTRGVGRVSRESALVAAFRPNRAWRNGACRRNVPGLAGPREVNCLWWSGSTGSRARRIPCLCRRSASVVVSFARDDVAGRLHPCGDEPRTRNTPSVESLSPAPRA